MRITPQECAELSELVNRILAVRRQEDDELAATALAAALARAHR